MGSLFVTTYTLALGDPVPRRIDAALVGDPRRDAGAVRAVQGVAENSLDFTEYESAPAALRAIDLQRVYAALDLTPARPTLYVASAAGASVARVLEKISSVDPTVRVVDTHPLASTDPNGLDIFYLMLVATIIGFITVFQTRALAGGLPLRHWAGFVVALALAAALALTLVEGPIMNRLDIPVLGVWGILAMHILAVASFASVMTVLIGRWAMIPTWLFFVVLGNSSSGGAVSPPLLPAPFAAISQWLPSGATVTSLRDAIYFPGDQHTRPILVLSAWAAALFAVMVAESHRRRTSPGWG
jgi:hypothetical protein